MSATSRAILFAEAFRADDGNTLHIYDDGYVVVISCSADRHLDIRGVLKRQWPDLEEARSSDGFKSVFLITQKVRTSSPSSESLLAVLTDGYHDHRDQDHHTIEDVVGLFTRCRGSL